MTDVLIPQEVWDQELMASKEVPADWLWQGFVARGNVTLLTSMWKAGKTTLLSSWIQSLPQQNPEAVHVAWLSLDEDDNEPVLFWRYALTALDSQQQGVPGLRPLRDEPVLDDGRRGRAH